MSSPNAPVLQQLNRLKRSSSDFHDQLCNIIYGEEYVRCAPDLEGDDLVWLVEYLDRAFGDLDPSSPASRKCLRELRSICGTRAILPTSYMILPDLLNVGPNPFTGGSYGDVYEGTLNGSKVCVKRIRVYTEDTPKAAKTFCQEAVMWKRLTHPNILPLLGVTINHFQLISDWMSGGDPQCYIKNNSDADRLRLLSDIVKGLCYLHSCNVIHGDLKGPNILVDSCGHARITDFGLAMVTQSLDSIRSAQPQRGHTVRWAAPEVLNEGPHSKEADMFSFAMVMIEVFTGTIPFSGRSTAVAMSITMQGKRPPRPTHPSFTENMWALMQRCWEHEPHLRPEVSEAIRVLLVPEDPAWKRLISCTLTAHERISLITVIFSDRDEVDMVGNLSGDNAQSFIDVIDEALDSLEPEIRRRCLRSLYKICGSRALLPRSLEIPLYYDTTKTPMYHGWFADVWKGQHHGQEVAAKVLRAHIDSDFERIEKRFCKEVVAWRFLRHPNVLPLLGVTTTEARFVMVSQWMVNGKINEFVKVNVNADRLELLRDVTKGLIYIHDQGVVHGDLKGTNILINHDGRACLAGFTLISIVSDQSPSTSPFKTGGTINWMSPELLDSERFGLKESRPTKESDYYALGMVVYEVLSGQRPFAPYSTPVVIWKILGGERPGRPEGAQGSWFTDDIWRMLGLCWKAQPGDRPGLNTVLRCLESVTRPYTDGDVEVDADAQSVTTTASDSSSIIARPTMLSPGLPAGPHDNNELPVPPHRFPRVAGPMIQQDGGQLPDQPHAGTTKEEWTGDRLARSTRKMFKAATRKLFGP